MSATVHAEEEFLLDKKVQCKVCKQTFQTKMVRNSKIKRLDPDMDLRPRFMYIDTLKYEVTFCPYCGYAAMNRYFDLLVPRQAKLIQEQICSKYQPTVLDTSKTYTYDTAIERYKMALMNTMVKKGKTSELAYTCLKISWLLRGKAETMTGESPEEKKALEECKAEEEKYYEKAYNEFLNAIATEDFPICGMDQVTMDYLIAYMSYHFGKYEVASKSLSSVITSPSASPRMKDKALELKDEIVAKLRK